MFWAVSVAATETAVPEAEARTLAALFGASFGEVVPEGAAYTVFREESGGETVETRMYSRLSEKAAQGAARDEWRLSATPVTRRVVAMRFVAWVRPPETADGLFAATVRKVEALAGRIGEDDGEGDVVFRFEGGDSVTVSDWRGPFDEASAVAVFASSPRFDGEAARETAERDAAEAVRCAADLAALAPLRDGRPEALFGIAFGVPCGAVEDAFPAAEGAWEVAVPAAGPFLGCDSFSAIATAETRRVFLVRAVWRCGTAGGRCDLYRRLARLVERATGMEGLESVAGSPEHGEEQVLECGDLVVELTNDPARGEVAANFLRASLMEEHWRERERGARLPVLPARQCRRHGALRRRQMPFAKHWQKHAAFAGHWQNAARCAGLRARARVCDNSGCGAALSFRLRKAAAPGGTNMASEGFPVPQTSTTMLKQIAGASGHPRWTEFVAKYRPMLEGYMHAAFPTLDADEVVQETFLGIMRALVLCPSGTLAPVLPVSAG